VTFQPRDILKSVFGYDTFRPGQEEIVNTLMAGQHVLAVMPTGAGKSLCFQVPALAREGLAIVVSPLVALMQDQVAALKLAGVAAETINSAADRDENVAIWRRVAAGDVRILYLSPERLMTDRMISALQKLPMSLIAVDEVHCMSQWGASFRPEYDLLQSLRVVFPNVPIGAFTATADDVTRQDIVRKLFGDKAKIYVAGFNRPNISLTVKPKTNSTKQILEYLEDHRGESGIVYSLSRKSTESWADELRAKGFKARAYHAGLSPRERDDVQNAFMTEKGLIVCATIAFGMGIDKPDVRFVVHADLPSNLDAYYQEIGRAGRDGEPAEAHMLFGLQDIRLRRTFIDQEEGATQERKRREHKRLDALVAYCEAPDCRRQSLLGYFGEFSDPCGNCDVCNELVEKVDGTSEARQIIATIRATGERFGAIHIVDVLRGKTTAKVTQFNHQRLEVFGIGQLRSRQDWQSLIRQLVGGGILALDVAGFGGLSIASKGRSIEQGEAAFRYRPDLVRDTKRAERRKAHAEVTSAANVNDTLLQRLKQLRFSLAKQRHVPAYVIFSDRTLIDLAARKPLTKWDFAEVHGVGQAKLEQFGEAFIGEIKGYVTGA
jgi:ATP-dependent DNA helicase RecQ